MPIEYMPNPESSTLYVVFIVWCQSVFQSHVWGHSLFQRTLYFKHNNHVFYLYVSFVLSKEPQTCALVWFTPKIDPETRIHVQVAPRKHLQGDRKYSKGRQSIKAVSLNKFPLWETDVYSCHRTLRAVVDHTSESSQEWEVGEGAELFIYQTS